MEWVNREGNQRLETTRHVNTASSEAVPHFRSQAPGGSTLTAAEQTGRKAFLMEFDPAYCDVIVRRWEEFTGRRATRRTLAACVEHGTHARRTRQGQSLGSRK